MPGLIREAALLSERFEDNGVAMEYLTAASHKVVEAIRRDIRSNALHRVPHRYCPLCNGQEVFLIARKDRLGLPLETVICKRCGLIFSAEYFSEESAGMYYGRYANQLKNLGRTPGEMFKARTHPQSYSWLRYKWIKYQLGESFPKIETVVEIGCNDGCNLYPFYQNGMTVFGCDYDEDRMNAGRSAGLTLLSGSSEQLEKRAVKADVLILSHSLEHMPDIDDALKKAKNLLADNGLIYIEVPGLMCWNRPTSRRISDDWITSSSNLLGFLQLEHNYFFEWRTLTRFFLRNGLVPLCGDEYIRTLLKAGEKARMNIDKGNEGKKVLEYLLHNEKDWRKHNPLWKETLRSVKRYFWRFKGAFQI